MHVFGTKTDNKLQQDMVFNTQVSMGIFPMVWPQGIAESMHFTIRHMLNFGCARARGFRRNS